MRKVLGVVGVGVLFAGPALAADLGKPVYKAPPAVAPVFSWTGWYAGLNAGGGWSDHNGIDNTVTSTFCNTNFAGCSFFTPTFSDSLAAAVPGRFDTHPKGFIGGGQIGYNYQFAPSWVAGLEADFQGADIKGRATGTNTAGFLPTIVTGAGGQKIDFFGTLRGRLGWLPVNSLLVYGTGGLAYAHTQTDVSFSEIAGVGTGMSGATSASASTTRVGWTVGGGLEWMIAPHWSVKGEYLYYDLGHVTLNSTLPQIFEGALEASAGISSDAHYKGNIARVGVNYHF